MSGKSGCKYVKRERLFFFKQTISLIHHFKGKLFIHYLTSVGLAWTMLLII